MNYDQEFIDTLWEHLEGVLGVVVDTFGQAGLSLPERQYVTFSQPVHDCEQLTVQFFQMYMGAPGDQAQQMQRCDGLRSAMAIVELVRCTPQTRSGKPPTSEQMNAFAQQQAADAWMLLEAGTKVNIFGVLADVAVGEASGGYQAVTLTVTTVVDSG